MNPPSNKHADLDGVRRAWEAISANDFDRFIERVDPNVTFTSLIAEAEAVTYCGHKGVRRWWDSIREIFTELWADAIELREVAGNQILAQIRLCGTVQGRRVEQTMWQVLDLEDGLVVSWTVFRTEGEALEAAGA